MTTRRAKHVELTCTDCRDLLPRYHARELSPRLRSRVGTHLDSCDACYAIYCDHRAVARELASEVPLIGSHDVPRFQHMWNTVQVEMQRSRRAVWQRSPWRLSIAVAILLAGMLLPWMANAGRWSALALPAPPTPVDTSEVLETELALQSDSTPEAVMVVVRGEGQPRITVTPPANPNDPPPTSQTDAETATAHP
jgi:anti-sigma factor RsiW